MTRDPLYQEICTALNGELDEDLFQKCAADLLRDAYPSLALMTGGDDGGYDAAIGTPEGAFPLLVTIDKKGPLANLRKNLTRYLTTQDGPRLAVVATPRVVTNRKKRNLSAAASTLGIRLVNTHDQEDFAQRLYRNDRWRLELLGISGRPGALSAFPLRFRPERPTRVGREEDLRWIRNTAGDLLLVGQPGVGKTYLHEVLVSEGRALFAVDGDNEHLANALRSHRPEVVIVDDAHEALDIVQTLRRLRVTLGFKFDIHANCWPHREEQVCAAFELPRSHVRRVDLLTREEMLTVLNELGIAGPDQLLNLLIDQAEGKPGLVTALVAATKRGDIQRVWSGDALAESLIHGRQLLREPHELPVLAALALGGDEGASPSEVADWLGLGVVQVAGTLVNLAAGGVVEEVGRFDDRRVAVRPPALRGVLIRDAFYKGPQRIDPTGIVKHLRADRGRINGLTQSLLAARQRGADIANGLLLELAADADADEIWRHFGYVDQALNNVLIRDEPAAIPRAADGLLRLMPETALPHLLALAAESDESQRTQIRRKVKEWIEGDEPGGAESVPRRQQLLAAVRASQLGPNQSKALRHVRLIRSRGHFLKGRYDVHDGSKHRPASAPAVHG